MNGRYIAAAVAVLLLAVTACTAPSKRYTIGVAQCSEDSWRSKLNEELRTGVYMHDDIDIGFASADDDDSRQIAQIDSFVRAGVDLLIVSPNHINSISEAINRAYDSGIPVILIDRKIGSGKYTAFIGADNVAIGRSIGEYVATRLGGRGNVLEIQGLEGSSPAIERHRGFDEVISRYPDINIVAAPHGTWLEESGYVLADSVLGSIGTTRIDCVFGHNDRTAVGAYKAMARHGRQNDGVLYAGIDALSTPDGGIARVADSTLTVSCIYPTRGDMVLKLAMDILEGRPYNKENTLPVALVTRDNAGVMLLQAEEMAHQNRILDELHDKVDAYFVQYSHQKVYLLLVGTIALLVIVFLFVAYRTVVMRRRMAVDAANAKLVFFTNMSHEFRTPLTLIADPVEQMLADGNLTPQQRSRLETVGRNAKVLLRLVGEILDFRKVQNGKMELMPGRFSLTSHVAGWVENFRPMADSKGITLDCDTPDAEIVMVNDLYKVERICYNLLSNALKHTRRGGMVTLGVAREGDIVRLSVTDTGEGIPRDKLPHVFERFYQVRGGAAGGTGIGLAIVKAFAGIMGGKVAVESEEGRGSVFTVTLPVEIDMPEEGQTDARGGDFSDGMAGAADNGGVTAAAGGGAEAGADVTVAKRAAAATGEGRPAVLVVDDNADIRQYIASLLDGRYDVIYAEDGADGLKRAMECVPDLVVSDVMMPVMDGMEMCRRLKGETATSHIPVLMLTARTMEEQRAEGYECGADAYITKPFSGKVLTARIENLLESRRRLRRLFASAAVADTPQRGDTAVTAAAASAAAGGEAAADGEAHAGAPVPEPALNGADMRFIARLNTVIAERMTDSGLSVETISAEMGLSRVQLYRKVKTMTGVTPVEMIRTARLTRADRLLAEGGRTVSEISYEVGFSSPSYFIKCYKDHFGHTPAAK